MFRLEICKRVDFGCHIGFYNDTIETLHNAQCTLKDNKAQPNTFKNLKTWLQSMEIKDKNENGGM
jgi:hypothetical protein